MSGHDMYKEFADMCVERGFSKHRKVFTRCVGDGVIQNITISQKCYVDPHSSEYSSETRKAPIISFWCGSMYSNYPDKWFNDRRYLGWYYPENIMGIRNISFQGFKNQFEIMQVKGFDLLDSITTQEQLVRISSELQEIEYSGRYLYDYHICAPLVICKNYHEATSILFNIYAYDWMSFKEKYDYLINNGQYEEYIQKEKEFDGNKKELKTYIYRVLGNRYDDLKVFFESNLKNNVEHLKHNKIAFSKDFKPLVLNDIMFRDKNMC